MPDQEFPDAMIIEEGDPNKYYRINDCIMLYEDAIDELKSEGFTEEEAKQYIRLLKSEYVVDYIDRR